MPGARNLLTGNLRLTGLHGSRLAVGAYGLLRRAADRLGLQVVVKSFYSPIPDLAAVDSSVWERRSALSGIDLNLELQLALLENELAPFIREFDPPRTSTTPSDYYLDNPSYGPVDAETLYGFVRHSKPRRIVELGSGFTTLVLSRASLANGREGEQPELKVFDPFPSIAGPSTPGVSRFERLAAQEVPLDVFDELEPHDLLVVDTTHTVRLGGDVNRIVLEVLPRLGPGVLAHLHDIFLPWEYPRVWLERFGLYWTEQYLLQAFLACNSRFEVVCSLHALAREHPHRLSQLYPSWRDGLSPAAFWIRSRN